MPTLIIGTRTYSTSNARIIREAERMFKLSPEQRAHRLARAKSVLARAADANTEDQSPTKAAVATILSRGVTEI